MGQRRWGEVAVRKAPKAGISASGDSVDVVERARGGLSVVMADGQGSGPAAKRISNWVVARATSLIAEGTRDGAAARAVHDNLLALRGGRVLCTLIILTVDLDTGTFVLSRNGNAGGVLYKASEESVVSLNREAPPIGVHHFNKPVIIEEKLHPGDRAAVFTDGVTSAPSGDGVDMVTRRLTGRTAGGVRPSAADLADDIFASVLRAAGGRPADDTSLAVVSIREEEIALGEVAIRSVDFKLPFR